MVSKGLATIVVTESAAAKGGLQVLSALALSVVNISTLA